MSDITLPTGQRSTLMTPVDINGTVITSLLALESGGNLAGINGKLPSLGAKTSTGSVSFTPATDATFPISGSLTNISGTISLPTGAATSANQATANTSLSSIDGKLPSLGQKVASGSISIIQASDAFSLPVTTSKPSVVITRGANTTTYTTDDVWGARFALTLPITGDGIKSVILTRINLVTSLTSLPSGFGSFRLFLFQNTTDSGNITDNNAFTQRTTAIDVDGYLLTQMQKATNDLSGRSTTFDLNVPINLDVGVTQLFGYLVTNAGYTPAAATADTITLRAHFMVA